MYFSTCETVADVRTLYRKLAFRWHPDRGGDNETMKIINAEYELALQGRHGETVVGDDGKPHTYYYNAEVEREVMDKLADLLRMKMKDAEIELVGTWLWVHGDTKPYKENLKGLKMLWHSKRQMWYFRTRRAWRYSGVDFDALRHRYGSRDYVPAEAELT